jgi:hypothetical protein
VVFLLLMADRQMPALWALPAGTGDVIVGVTALRSVCVNCGEPLNDRMPSW